MKKKEACVKTGRRSRGDRPTGRDAIVTAVNNIEASANANDVDESVGAIDENEVSDVAEAEASADFDSSATADESFGILQGDDLREAIAELRRLGNRNGGYVTFDEMNRLLPQDTVDAVLTERMLKALEMGGVEVIREEDIGAWKKAKTNDAVETERMTEDPIRLYMRQMGRVELLPPDEEERIFKSIEDSQEFVRNAFCRFAFAAPMFARVLDQLEGQSVRFDHVVTDEYEGDRDAYISQIPEFRRMLKRARGDRLSLRPERRVRPDAGRGRSLLQRDAGARPSDRGESAPQASPSKPHGPAARILRALRVTSTPSRHVATLPRRSPHERRHREPRPHPYIREKVLI